MQPAVTLALLPVLLPQALWVRMRAARLCEANGPRAGNIGDGPPLRLLILGDSSAAGVGVAHQRDGLAGQLVDRLAPHRRVTWRLLARCGDTTGKSLARLQELDAHYDIAVTALGVNDVKNGVPQARWKAQTEALWDRLQTRYGVRRILVTGLPPLGDFPLLPSPLRAALGARAARFNAALADMEARHDAVTVLRFDLPLAPQMMAEDGFHPGPELYAIWAEYVAQAILE